MKNMMYYYYYINYVKLKVKKKFLAKKKLFSQVQKTTTACVHKNYILLLETLFFSRSPHYVDYIRKMLMFFRNPIPPPPIPPLPAHILNLNFPPFLPTPAIIDHHLPVFKLLCHLKKCLFTWQLASHHDLNELK